MITNHFPYSGTTIHIEKIKESEVVNNRVALAIELAWEKCKELDNSCKVFINPEDGKNYRSFPSTDRYKCVSTVNRLVSFRGMEVVENDLFHQGSVYIVKLKK